MLELVQSMLDLARIDLGVALTYEPISVRDMLTSIVDEFHSQALTKAQTLQLETIEGYPQVRGDSLRLRQAIRNLVGNAIKYTAPGGQINLSTHTVAQSIQINVTDTGFGIPAADLPFIFDKFYRVHTDETRDIEGNGLGLAIVKAIIEQHNGLIEVQSTVGVGSRFTVTVPTRLPTN
jgi:signal transduction histidine kinase